MLPAGQEVLSRFDETLKTAQTKYDFTEKYPIVTTTQQPPTLSNQQDNGAPLALNSSTPKAKRASDEAASGADSPNKFGPPRELDPKEATKIWDNLQARGCCGRTNATVEWQPNKIPKSCCARELLAEDGLSCKIIDSGHQKGCLALIEATSLNLFIVLALIAVVSFYLAGVSGISTYRTFHYNEANQSAYS